MPFFFLCHKLFCSIFHGLAGKGIPVIDHLEKFLGLDAGLTATEHFLRVSHLCQIPWSQCPQHGITQWHLWILRISPVAGTRKASIIWMLDALVVELPEWMSNREGLLLPHFLSCVRICHQCASTGFGD